MAGGQFEPFDVAGNVVELVAHRAGTNVDVANMPVAILGLNNDGMSTTNNLVVKTRAVGLGSDNDGVV